MILQRQFSDNATRDAIGITATGALGTYGAAKLAKSIATKRAAILEGKKAKNTLREGLEELYRLKGINDKYAEKTVKGARTDNGSLFDFFKKYNNEKADKAYQEVLDKNLKDFKEGAKKLKAKIKVDKSKAISKASKLANNRMLKAGLIATGALAGSRLLAGNKEDNV